LIALSLTDTPLASALFALQPFLLLLYTVFLSFFLLQILKEEISKLTIGLKLFAIGIMFTGTWLII
jgi:hypothetical protein